jgi:hypothetical protein
MKTPISINRYWKKPMAIIVDLDGSLFNIDHRLYTINIQPSKPNWIKFESLMLEDQLVEWVADIIRLFHQSYFFIFILTGRRSYLRDITKVQLAKNNIPYDFLLMKDDEDIDSPSQFKEKHLLRLKDQYKIVFAIEDEKEIVEMYKKHNVSVLHIDPVKVMPWENFSKWLKNKSESKRGELK